MGGAERAPDGVDITDCPTDFRGGTAGCTLAVAVIATAASIGGVVHDDRGRPVAQARVVIVPEQPSLRGQHSRYVKSVETGANGRFLIPHLLPGRYRIAAVPYLDEGSWQDLETLARLQPVSVPHTLAANERAEVTLALRPLR